MSYTCPCDTVKIPKIKSVGSPGKGRVGKGEGLSAPPPLFLFEKHIIIWLGYTLPLYFASYADEF